MRKIIILSSLIFIFNCTSNPVTGVSFTDIYEYTDDNQTVKIIVIEFLLSKK
ncbi:hypothetical protein [Chryseobacterium sp. JUb7]|uniref:hypothetical protein n=1 Tax=Chryseobacterium sp. JUb7 TaxID=2940599 RepID=UPI0021671201|nr:hypothetical protein [Chryseobacterium sp. JUb7]